jgi:cytochrome b involved in lipid metabolism
MKKVLSVIFVLAAILLVSCAQQPVVENQVKDTGAKATIELGTTGNTATTGSGAAANNQAVKYSLEDVAKHNTKEDCWMVIEGKVYDMDAFIALGVHKPIDMFCGKDGTSTFNARPGKDNTPHPQQARDSLQKYYVGDLA